MNKALIIIPYFGTIPVWFQVFLDSCSSAFLDFLLITDDTSYYQFPANFRVIYQSFDEFTFFFRSRLGEEVYLAHPYKLCDYKPTYGKVFSSEIKGYQYWGYCDIDLVFGDIDHFLEKFFETGFDKFSRLGHFSLYKNTDENNSLFRMKTPRWNFGFVKSTTIPCLFDEIAINDIFIEKKKNLIHSHIFHNVNMNYKNFAVGDGLPNFPTLIVKRGFKLYLAELREGCIYEKEFFYVHIHRRPNLPKPDRLLNYVITVDGFLPFADEKELLQLFSQFGLPASEKEELAFRKKCRKSECKEKLKKLRREIKFFKFRGMYNILFHYYLSRQ
ncbi:DUF6625 family protein [Kaistella rhinocerotis]|uniref:DUF6625 family protein n=1 Tax=Kaistella rhinocerotis TaxID=3026437 RepID=UPI0025525CAE|nr:DUF6625 family protein [Kaistella sp. Ran72]